MDTWILDKFDSICKILFHIYRSRSIKKDTITFMKKMQDERKDNYIVIEYHMKSNPTQYEYEQRMMIFAEEKGWVKYISNNVYIITKEGLEIIK